MRKGLVVGGLVLVMAVLGGCAAGPQTGPSSAPTAPALAPSPEVSETPAPMAGPSAGGDDGAHVDVADAPGSLPGLVGALQDAQVEGFERRGDSWLAWGTVRNTGEAAVDYRIYASAMGDAGATTRGVVQVDVPGVGAGETVEWEASFPLVDEDLTLVLRVERAAGTG